MTRRELAIFAAGFYLAVLLDLTLGRFYQPNAPTNFIPLRSIAADLHAGGRGLIVNILGNLLAFAPIGLLLPMIWAGSRRFAKVGLLAFLLSFGIEVLQYRSGKRVADVDDLILNVAGAWLGLGGFAIIQSLAPIFGHSAAESQAAAAPCPPAPG